jgi:hypothetical protein
VTMGVGFGVAVGTLIAGILAVIALALPFFVASVVTFTAAWVVHRKVPETVR